MPGKRAPISTLKFVSQSSIDLEITYHSDPMSMVQIIIELLSGIHLNIQHCQI